MEKKFRNFLNSGKDDKVDKVINIVKEQNGKIFEIVTVDIIEISSIQVEDFYKK